jgi:hypothetical protein
MLATPPREIISMRTIARPEPDIDDINDPLILRDRVYSELRAISSACEKLAHRTNLVVAIKLATLPVRTEGE